tara:strand:- start:1355 stop:1576 length:222 start_codon:yes stop_codon:yes gene_type:complete
MGANTSAINSKSFIGFNPRTRDGCESVIELSQGGRIVSIHAPVMGAKSEEKDDYLNDDVSIHAPVMGAKDQRS